MSDLPEPYGAVASTAAEVPRNSRSRNVAALAVGRKCAILDGSPASSCTLMERRNEPISVLVARSFRSGILQYLRGGIVRLGPVKWGPFTVKPDAAFAGLGTHGEGLAVLLLVANHQVVDLVAAEQEAPARS